jgi:hypothetical protein
LYPFIAFEVTQTFGGLQTYMNRVYLYSDEVTASPTSSLGSGRPAGDLDGTSITSHSDIVSPAQPLNISELSYLTAEQTREDRNRTLASVQDVAGSYDTAAVAQRLQQALGLAADLDDSYVEEEESGDEERRRIGQSEGRPGYASTPGTVAGRVAALEQAVSAMSQSLISLSRSPSPQHGQQDSQLRGSSPLRSPRRAQSPLHDVVSVHSSVTPVRSRRSQQSDRSPAASSRASREQTGTELGSGVGRIDDRIARLEEKFEYVMDTMLQRAEADAHSDGHQHGLSSVRTSGSRGEGHRPPQPPPPPPPPLSTPHLATVLPRSVHSNQSFSYTTLSNVTSSSKSRKPAPAPSQDSPARRERANGVVDDTLQGMEAMIRRVLREQGSVATSASAVSPSDHHKASHSSCRAPAQSSTASSPARSLNKSRQSRDNKSPASPSSSRKSGSRERVVSMLDHGNQHSHHNANHNHNNHRSKSRVNSNETESDSDSEESEHGTHRNSHRHARGDVRTYVAGNAERLVRQERVREILQQAAQFAAEPLPSSPPPRRPVTHPVGARSRRVVGSSGSESDASEEAKYGELSGLRTEHHHKPNRTTEASSPALEVTNALEKSIFDLLKAKYGLQVGDGSGSLGDGRHDGAPRTHPSRTTAGSHGAAVRRSAGPLSAPSAAHRSLPPESATLPMRTSLEASRPGGTSQDPPVVDWGQYVHNRVASRSSSPDRPASPLRPGTAGVYTVAGVVVNSSDHIDVLARAKQSMRDTRRTLHGTASVSSSGTDGAAGQSTGNGANTVRATAAAATHATAEESEVAVPQWCGDDADIAQLVKALHAKVYERTIKEAQYDILVMGSQRS